MDTNGPSQPAEVEGKLSNEDEALREHALITCAYCREKHGGWCIDELTPPGQSACPLASLAGTLSWGVVERRPGP